MRHGLPITLLLAAMPSVAEAQTNEAPPAPPAPYSLPWLLRPMAVGNVIRADTTVASYADAAGHGGTTLVESFTASRRLTPRLAGLFRVSAVHHHTPGATVWDGSGVSNLMLGVNYVRPLSGPWRLALLAGSTLPVGAGGGHAPSASCSAAMAAAMPARSAMDNALFAVNYWTLLTGASVARVSSRLTLQLETTLVQITRVRGSQAQDASRTNFTAGLHAGHFFGQRLSIGGELHVQRWLSDAAPIRRDAAAREAVTFCVGPRLHFKLGRHWLRPGVGWSRALDDPVAAQSYDIVQLDLPFSF